MYVTKMLFSSVFFTLMLVGCNSKPTNLDIENGLKEKYECNSLSVVDVNKTNGKEKDKNNYYVEFSYKLKLKPDELPNSREEFSCSMSAVVELYDIMFNAKTMKKEEFLETYVLSGLSFEGQVTMEKTENGWRMTDDLRTDKKR